MDSGSRLGCGSQYCGARAEDAGNDESGVLVYCPPCAAAVFNYPLAAAAGHVCVWKPQPPPDPETDNS